MARSIIDGVQSAVSKEQKKERKRTNQLAKFIDIQKYIASEEVQKAAQGDPGKFFYVYKSVFENSSFVRAIESTTKSITATKYRYVTWYSLIKNEFGISLRLPVIKDNA